MYVREREGGRGVGDVEGEGGGRGEMMMERRG